MPLHRRIPVVTTPCNQCGFKAQAVIFTFSFSSPSSFIEVIKMLSRSLRVPPSLYLFIAICVLFVYHLSQDALITDLAAPKPASSASSSSLSSSSSSSSRKSGPRIGIVTFVAEQHSYIHTSLRNKARKQLIAYSIACTDIYATDYARRQGYDFIIDYETHAERGIMWWKFEMLSRAIKENKYDWLWWLDFDTLITNTNIKLSDVIEESLANVTNPNEIDYLLTHDCNGLNMGSFVLRAHERSIKFFADTAAIYAREKKKGTELSEQDSLVKLLKDDPATGRRTIQVPQWKLNAFPEEIACYDESEKGWEDGTFAVHFAGAWAHVQGKDPTGRLMRKYEQAIMWGDWKDVYGDVTY
jgi:mannan polymerase II complex MNN10 subunit